MKNSSNFILRAMFIATLYLAALSVLAQGNSAYLYVYPTEPTAYPNSQGGVSNPVLQTLFQQFQVKSYAKSFPGAESVSLQNAYAIHLEGDATAFKSALDGTGYFSKTELQPYMVAVSMPVLDCPEPCANPQSVNDPNSGYELTLPGYLCAWNLTQGEEEIVVAVVDTDFDLNHPDLQGKVISKTGTPGDPECAWHGNIVAATIVATPNNGTGVAGVAPGARVAGYVVNSNWGGGCRCSGDPWPSVWQAYQDGRRIISVSWTGVGNGGGADAVRDAITEMVQNGVLLIVAAGNDDPGYQQHSDYYDIPGVLDVSSISSDGTLHEWVTYNQGVDLCAPGDAVGTITYSCGGNTYNHAWGTSLSAPNTAGAAALILSVNPCLKPTEIENILKTTTCPIENPTVIDVFTNMPHDDYTGTGYLNAYAAVEKAKGFSGTISQNDSPWSGENYVSADVIVPSGVTLTINGITKFSEGAGLVIEPGGRVNLYGKLTNSCAGPWNGVTIKGNANQSQWTAGQHGRLNTYSGAVIENATTGVRLWDGGIIAAAGTTFQNNGTGIEYCPYQNFWPFNSPPGQLNQPRNHFGGLTDCMFFNDDSYSDAAKFNAFVQMNGVHGIGMSGCSFINERTVKNPSGNDAFGYGIKSTDSRFTVASRGIGNTFPPTQFDHTGFYGLGYGVYAGTAQTPPPSGPNNSFVNVPYTVQQATFENCVYGIHNRFVSQGVIVGNTFKLGNLPPANPISGGLPFTNTQFGVYFENGANGFEIQENNFIGEAGNVQILNGSYCTNLGWFNNDIRRNTYTNVVNGNIADSDNAQVMPDRGLHYLCNINSNQDYDFYVFGGADIRRNQGLFLGNDLQGSPLYNAAGNTFTKLHAPDGDFSNGGPTVRYYHDGIAEKPQFFSNMNFSDVDPNTCTSDFCLPPCKSEGELAIIKNEYNIRQIEYNIVKSELQTAINQGNTAQIEVKEQQAAGLRNVLDKFSNIVALHEAYDTATYHPDTLRQWWKNMDSPVSEMNLARDYYKNGQQSLAISMLNNMPSKYALSEQSLADLSGFKEIMLLMQGESATTISQSKVEQLLAYANEGFGISSAWAKNILTVKGYHFPPLPRMPQGSAPRNSENERHIFDNPENYRFTVSPNPAKDFVAFKKKDTEQILEPITIIVTDITGKKVFEMQNASNTQVIWNTAKIQKGIYFYNIRFATIGIQSGRIVIVK